MKHGSKSWYYDILLLTLIISLLFGLFLGSFPLKTPDGARYAEIPREMLAMHQYITPHLNGIKYFDKPPLFYWMQCASIKLFGLSEWSMRFMNAFMGLLGCLFIYVAGRKIYDRKTGFLASLILATSGLYFFMSHLITLDIAFTTFFTAALLSFIIGTRSPPETTRKYWMWLMYIFAAMATMTKGLIGIVFPGMIIFVWVLLLNRWKELKTYKLISGTVIFLILVAPWHILIQIQHPEFFHYYFIEQHFARYLTQYSQHSQPIYFFPGLLILGFAPWIVFLFHSIKHSLPKTWNNRNSEDISIFFMLWALLIFVFYWCSKSQLIPYILPVFPPLAILTGRYFARYWKPKTFIITCCTAGIILIAGFYVYATLINPISTKPFAEKLLKIEKPGDKIVVYASYLQDLPFYLRRRITIANWAGEDLIFGMQHQDTSSWMIGDAKFIHTWNNKNRVYVVTNKDNFHFFNKLKKPYHIIMQNGANFLISN